MARLIRYIVRIPSIEPRRVCVTATCSGFTVEPFMLGLPSRSHTAPDSGWSVESLVARSQAEPVGLCRVDNNVWAIAHGGARELQVEYVLRAPKAGENHVDIGHIYLEGRALFVRPLDERERSGPLPCELAFDLTDPSWRVHTTLDATLSATGVQGSYAADLDALTGSVFEATARPAQAFTAAGKPHSLITSGSQRGIGSRPVTADLTPVIERAVELFGEAPYARFLFILHLSARRRAIACRRDSVTVWCPSKTLDSNEGYRDLLSRLFHGFCHVWYGESSPGGTRGRSRLLWLFEGAPRYLAWKYLKSAGSLSPEGYRKHIECRVKALDPSPKQKLLTLEDASLDGWIYQSDDPVREHYDAMAELVAMLLDDAISARSGGKSSLDDVLRHLWQKHGSAKEPPPEDGLEAVFAAATGVDLSDMIETYTRSTEALPVARALKLAEQ